MPPSLYRTVLLTALTLVAFAGNSILCRMALRGGAIDPVGFTALRLASGALVLLPFLRKGPGGTQPGVARPWSPRSAAALAAYAIAFSLAYVRLDAGTGALILFGSVQVTMIGAGLLRGERPSAGRALGFALALVGAAWLVAPGATAPDGRGALLMGAAGVGWGVYSLFGRAAPAPTRATACNFALAAPAGLLLALLQRDALVFSQSGVLLAVTSGALTSGLGYVLWYATLPGHSRASAAVVQLAVPVIAALAGVLWLDEALSARLVYAGALTLGGVGLAVVSGNRPAVPEARA